MNILTAAPYKNHVRTITAFLAVLIFMAGCATFPGKPTVEVKSDGQIEIQGNPVKLTDLPVRLARMGVEKRNRIEITLAEGVSEATRMAVARSLASAGFRNFYFVSPRKTSATSTSRTGGRSGKF